MTARCNFNCPMCYVHKDNEEVKASGRELSAEQWIKLAEEAKSRGMVFVLLTGGEPFVRKDFFEIYEAMKKMGLYISINSNGSFSKEVLDKLLENPPYRMNITIYGGSEETYKKMCGNPAFDKVVSNIRALKAGGIDVRANLSITPYNCEDLEKIYSLIQELNIHVKASSYMYPSVRVNGGKYGCGNRFTADESARYGVEWDVLRFSDEEFAMRAENMKKLLPVEENECSVEMESGIKCRAGSSSFWLTWDGIMKPCGMMPKPDVNVLEVGFDVAWDEIRRATKAIVTPGKCEGCPSKSVCGVCAAVTVTETGEFDKVPEYMCERSRKLIEYTLEMCEAKK